jgi:hypothetical protein
LYAWWAVKETREKENGAKGRLSQALGLCLFHKIFCHGKKEENE